MLDLEQFEECRGALFKRKVEGGYHETIDVAKSIVAGNALSLSRDQTEIIIWEMGNFAAYLVGNLDPKYGERCSEYDEANKFIEEALTRVDAGLQKEFRSGFAARQSLPGSRSGECEPFLAAIRRQLGVLL